MVETLSVAVVETQGCLHAFGILLGFPALAEE